jgi:hypothetical protein
MKQGLRRRLGRGDVLQLAATATHRNSKVLFYHLGMLDLNPRDATLVGHLGMLRSAHASNRTGHTDCPARPLRLVAHLHLQQPERGDNLADRRRPPAAPWPSAVAPVWGRCGGGCHDESWACCLATPVFAARRVSHLHPNRYRCRAEGDLHKQRPPSLSKLEGCCCFS